MRIEKRSLAGSDAYAVVTRQPEWSQWSVASAVREGYQANGWVYRAAKIIAESAASVPWAVFGPDGRIDEHALSKLLARPNAHCSRQKLVELLVLWMQLGGRAYLKKVQVNGATRELWPVSPDRMAPIPSADPALFIEGYRVRKDGGREENDPEYNAETVIDLKFTDPSNPYKGISPLGAAARAIDVDNAQQEWQGATMQNRGVVDGVFTFKRSLDGPAATSILERIKAKFSGPKRAREPLVIGDEATYTRLGLTAVEMDYLESRKAGRDEILGIFGVPPQLVGAMEASTYNNYATALRVFWVGTVLPLLDNIKDSLNTSFAGELGPGLWIGYDTSTVAALKEDDAAKVGVASKLSDMGVPVSVINDRLELGLTEYPGWDVPRPGRMPPLAEAPPDQTAPAPAATKQRASFSLVPAEQRSADEEAALRDKLADGEVFRAINGALLATREAVFADTLGSIEGAVSSVQPKWEEALRSSYMTVATKIAAKVARPKRNVVSLLEHRDAGVGDLMEQAIEAALAAEAVILTDLAGINATTVQTILDQVGYGLRAGWSVTQIQQAIIDTGVFSPERALTIARTTAGTASSLGQLTAGAAAGATHKIWQASHAHTRPQHEARHGETVPIDGRFSQQFPGNAPRYPLDPQIAAGDRINCRCFLTFDVLD